MEFTLIYTTTKDIEEARRIGRKLVEKRLVACINIIEKIESIYWWDGKLCDEQEALMFAKTVTEEVHHVIETIKDLHSYEVPAISCLDITDGNQLFLEWIAKEVGH